MSIEEKILRFVNEMDYLNNKHVLGILFYGSYLTGLNTNNSDIDLQIIFDNEDHNHFIRGNKIIDGTRIEYFEKPIEDIYLTVNEDYINQNNATLTIYGTSKIIYAKDNQVKLLQEYIVNKFSTPLPPLSDDEAKEQVSIINNRMEKLQKYAETDSPYFEHLYHLTIDKIRKFYHKSIGIPKISTSKVYRIYTDEDYRKSVYKENPEQEFINMYLNLITTNCENKLLKLQMIKDFYNYATRNINLGNNYRILIKSKNKQIKKNNTI